jgi:hypothetical protein
MAASIGVVFKPKAMARRFPSLTTGRQQNRRVEVIISDNDERVPERVAESVR